MATNERIPVLLWEDRAGRVTGALVADWDNTAAVGDSRREVLQQLKAFLDWHQEEYGFVEGGELHDLKLTVQKVEVRPEYRREERTFPCEETVRLRVPCVQGRDEDTGMLFCAIPTLGLRFSFHDERGLKGLVAHFVQNALKGATPASVARRFPPTDLEIDHIVFRARDTGRGRESKPWFERPEFERLKTVAEPFLGGRGKGGRFGAAWGRAPEVQDLARRLGGQKANVILLGPPGCGKTTLLADAVRKLSLEKVEEVDAELKRYRFWLTNAARLIAGTPFLGQWEERCEEVIEELADVSGVLCVESLLDLVHTGGQGPADSLASFLLPFLQRNEVRLVAEATPTELDACRRLLPGFVDAFQILRLEPFDERAALDLLDKAIEAKTRQTDVEAEPGAGALTRRLFARFMPYAAFPGRTVAFLRDAFDRAAEDGSEQVTQDLLLRRFVEETGLPELFLRDDLTLKCADVQNRLEERVIAQPAACREAAEVVTAFKAGMNDTTRPVASLFFCGPTGVGKTALARAMADFLFGGGKASVPADSANGDRLIRLDMSEYSLPGSASRLTLAPDGGPSDFIKRVRRQPFVVVLLDEIEKAAPEVFDVFLNVFDEGRLTDRLGRETVFRSAVIVVTSNLGAGGSGGLGFGAAAGPSYEDEAMAFFRPEFFNRIDSIVPFEPLETESIRLITEKELRELGQREGFAKSGLRLTWTKALVAHLAEAGFDLKLGARPLQRAIEREVVAPLARFLVERPDLQDAEIRMDWNEGEGMRIA